MTDVMSSIIKKSVNEIVSYVCRMHCEQRTCKNKTIQRHGLDWLLTKTFFSREDGLSYIHIDWKLEIVS